MDLVADNLRSVLISVVENVVTVPRLLRNAALSEYNVDIGVVVVGPVNFVVVEHHVANSRLSMANALIIVLSFFLSDKVPLATIIHLDHDS